MLPTTRRDVLIAGATVAGAASLSSVPGWARKRPPGLARSATFPSGVMAGRPQRQGALLWTQLGPSERAGNLRLEVASDKDFRRVVHQRLVAAEAARDGTVHVSARSRRIQPGEEYWYRFVSRTTSSPAGRFVTAPPPGSSQPLKVGFFSCQLWSDGYYTAHAGLAAEACDVIVCLGDYIYESNVQSNLADRSDRTSGGENGECELLGEYRAKYRLYRSDADLRAMHASACFIPTWDDHEVEDNHAGEHEGKTGDARPTRRIPYAERRGNAYAAFFEQMPVVQIDGGTRLYRRVPLGGMGDLFVLDLRQYRSDQTCGDQAAVPCPPPSDPNHTLLGRPQMEWFKGALAGSRARWKILATSVELMSWDSVPTIPLNRDGWDGYPADRAEIGEHVLKERVENVTALTGDVHHFAAGTVTTTGRIDGRPWATEFVGGSITSVFVDDPGATVVEQSQRTNPHMVMQEFSRRGYGVLEATTDGMVVRYRSPATTQERTAATETIAEFRVPAGRVAVEAG